VNSAHLQPFEPKSEKLEQSWAAIFLFAVIHRKNWDHLPKGIENRRAANHQLCHWTKRLSDAGRNNCRRDHHECAQLSTRSHCRLFPGHWSGEAAETDALVRKRVTAFETSTSPAHSARIAAEGTFICRERTLPQCSLSGVFGFLEQRSTLQIRMPDGARAASAITVPLLQPDW